MFATVLVRHAVQEAHLVSFQCKLVKHSTFKWYNEKNFCADDVNRHSEAWMRVRLCIDIKIALKRNKNGQKMCLIRNILEDLKSEF